MDVRIVIREVSVLAFANNVGQSTECERIDVFFEEHPLVKREPLSGKDFVFDGWQCDAGHSGSGSPSVDYVRGTRPISVMNRQMIVNSTREIA